MVRDMADPRGYSRGQIGLHWIIALLLVPQFLLHDGIKAAFRQMMKGGAASYDGMVWLHLLGGILILLLMLWRVALRVGRGAPPPPAEESALLKLLAKAVHGLLYLLLFLLPISGLVAWFGGAEAAAEAHELMKPLLLILVGLHVLGALYHQFVLKNGLIDRMKRPV